MVVFNPWALGVTGLTLIIIITCRRLNRRLPATLIALVALSAVVYYFDVDVETIGTIIPATGRAGLRWVGLVPLPALVAILAVGAWDLAIRLRKRSSRSSRSSDHEPRAPAGTD